MNNDPLPKLEFGLLGTPQISRNGVISTELTAGKAQALLYYLVMTAPSGRSTHTRAALATLLWGEVSDADARGNLRKVIQQLRDHFEPYLLIDNQTIGFQPAQVYTVDAVEFATAIKNPNTVHLDRLQQAIALYHGDFLEGFYVREAPDFEAWMLGERARLRELMLQGVETLALRFAGQGDLSQAITTARRLLDLEPWREETHRQLMAWLAQSGQRSAALAQYEICCRVLTEELDVAPGPETVALVEQIRTNTLSNQLAPREKVLTSELRPAQGGNTRHRLPPATTTFVGRQQELRETMQRLANPACRLLNLVGPGGIGKTRLALAVAQSICDFRILTAEEGDRAHRTSTGATLTFPDGVCWINLQPVGAVAALVPAIADAVEFALSGQEDIAAQLLRYLHNKSLLLVLDNFEQLVDPLGAATNLLIDIMQRAPGVKLLVTSREVINLQEEWLYPVGGLAFPTATAAIKTDEAGTALESYSAAQLFVERARQLQPTFAPTTHTDALIRLCQLTGGVPLALELAAAWIKLAL